MKCAGKLEDPVDRMHQTARQIEGVLGKWPRAIALAAAGVMWASPLLAQEPPQTEDDGTAEAVAAPATATATTATTTPSGRGPSGKTASLLDRLDDGDLPTVAPSPPPASLFRLEWHGYFRFRPEVINNGHLGMAVTDKTTGKQVITTSAVAPPLSLWPANNDPNTNPQASKVGSANEEEALAGASIRLRLMPTLHIGQDVRIHTTLDVLDNTVLGSDPDYAGALARPDVPLVGFTMSTRPGQIAVKEAYGEWKTMLGVLRVGRQLSHWGMGMLAHGGAGDGWDLNRPSLSYGGSKRTWEGRGFALDGGNYSDRAAFLTQIPKAGIYVSAFYDMLANGLMGFDPTRFDAVPRNQGAQDDVRQYGLAVVSRPLSDADAAARQKHLEDERKGALDWGLYALWRQQTADVQVTSKASGTVNTGAAAGQSQASMQDTQLMVRDAKALIADLWARYEKRLSPLRRIVLEGEFATIQGSIADTNALAGNADKARDIGMWGAAFKGAFQDEGMSYALDAGAASGDDTGCFGVFGAANCALTTAGGAVNNPITGFKFNRSFQVDHLLFREIVGSVTNAVYVRPTVSINAYPWYSNELMGLDVSVLQAFALDSKGTPGGGSNIGTEFSARGILGRRGHAFVDVVFAYALPGDALNLKEGWYDAAKSQEATNAWRLAGHVALLF